MKMQVEHRVEGWHVEAKSALLKALLQKNTLANCFHMLHQLNVLPFQMIQVSDMPFRYCKHVQGSYRLMVLKYNAKIVLVN